MKISLPEIRHNRAGFEELVRLHATLEPCRFTTIEIDLAKADWFDADMCAPLGAVLYCIGYNVNKVQLVNLQPQIERILSKNGFLSHYGRLLARDTYGTTIPYQRFDVKDDRFFASYVESKFVRRTEMPRMSSGLVKRFRESVFEIFSNAVIHSQTELGIFSCGQFFPMKNRLDFSVADLGIGIRRSVLEHTGLDLPADKAIVWATSERNTTKRGPIPGGLGLKLLAEFITLNGGRIQIVSDAGYWSLEKGHVQTALLSAPFPGTVVNVEINTADRRSYVLSSEVKETDIF
ncbi:MAG: ATP-binding protein [Nitrospirota bacterium]